VREGCVYLMELPNSYACSFSDGSVLLLYLPPNSPYPNDGIRWQDNEIKVIIPAGTRVREKKTRSLSLSFNKFIF